MNRIAYTSSVQNDNALRMARVLAAGRKAAERKAFEDRKARTGCGHKTGCDVCDN